MSWPVFAISKQYPHSEDSIGFQQTSSAVRPCSLTCHSGGGALGVAGEIRARPHGRRSPAERAGLRERDLLVALNGVAIDGVDTLQRVLNERVSGSATEAVVLRGPEQVHITITPISRPES
jgi:hypothetical protein